MMDILPAAVPLIVDVRQTGSGPAADMAEFRRPLAKWLIVALFVIFVVAGGALVATTLGAGAEGPPLAFTLLWLAALGWNAYWWLFRIGRPSGSTATLFTGRRR